MPASGLCLRKIPVVDQRLHQLQFVHQAVPVFLRFQPGVLVVDDLAVGPGSDSRGDPLSPPR